MSLRDLISAAALSTLRSGDYILVLGAGASLRATSSDARPLPGGQAFADEVITAMGLNAPAGTSLPYVWDAALSKLGSEQTLRARTTVPRFLHCLPAPHHKLLTTFAWSRIFTLNVDDVVVAAYKQSGGRLQRATAVHFDQDYEEPDRLNDEVQVIYLHGSELFPNRPLVFGPPAYAATVTKQHTWWHVFADAFVSQPVIVIGASLREPDFETYMALKRRPHRPLESPSYFVDPASDDITAALCARFGLVHIPLEAGSFLQQLSDLVPARESPRTLMARRITAPSLLAAVKEQLTLATLARQFVYVNDKRDWPQLRGDRIPLAFYDGYDPTWEDIREELDVQFDVARDVVASGAAFLASDTVAHPVRFVCIEGTPGSGKSASLMRSAVALAERGYHVFYYWGIERLRDDVLLEVATSLSTRDRFVIVVDDVADHIVQLQRFLSAFPANGARCLVLAACRANSKPFVERYLALVPERAWKTMPALTNAEALALVVKLRAAAKLGRFSGQTDSNLATKFVRQHDSDWGGQLLVILLELVPGGHFVRRLRSEWAAIPEVPARVCYGVLCVASAVGLPVKGPILLRAVGTPLPWTDSAPDGLAGLVVRVHQDSYKARHRVISEQIVRHCMTTADVTEFATRLLRAIAPYVSRHTIMDRTQESRIARQLMDADGLVVPRLGNGAEAWFASLQPQWEWNSRYWEQRALVALKDRAFERARDFAEQGLGAEKHPFPMTTCALVLLRSVEVDDRLDEGERDSMFLRGLELLDLAIALGRSLALVDEHPYTIMLTHAVAAQRKLGKRRAETAELLRRHATVIPQHFGSNRTLMATLEGVRRDYVIR